MILGALIIYLILRPQLKRVVERNYEVELDNDRLILKHDKLNQECHELKEEKEVLINSLTLLDEKAKDKANALYEQGVELAESNFNNYAEHLSQRYDELREKANQELLEDRKSASLEFKNELNSNREQLLNLQKEVRDFELKRDAIISAHKREEELALEQDKYKILLSDQDIGEIRRLKEVLPFMRNGRAISKIIWESYYRTPTNDLVNRVVGTGSHTGIYRITNLKSDKSYVGQAVNISDRWKQHIKCGIGIDTTQSKLYVAMLDEGPEAFKFEVLEECEPAKLNEREKFWIAYYKSDDWGYNMTKGGAKESK